MRLRSVPRRAAHAALLPSLVIAVLAGTQVQGQTPAKPQGPTQAVPAAPGAPAPAPAPSGAPTPALVLGTGTLTGLYLPAGAALCQSVDRAEAPGCLVKATDGSVANLKGLLDRSLDLALVQSDIQERAVRGEAPFEAPLGELRVLFSLQGEGLTLLARPDAGITSLEDLKGKRVNAGPANSALRTLTLELLAAAGVTAADLGGAGDLPPEDQPEALCDARIDVAAFVVGHPNGTVRQAMAECGAVPVEITGDLAVRLLAAEPALAPDVIPVELYGGEGAPIPTLGPVATLVARADLPEAAAYAVTRAVFQDLERLRTAHPALRRLDPKVMATRRGPAPIHPGAERYLREAGLLP